MSSSSASIVTEPKQVRLLVAETQQPTARAAVRNGCCCLLTHEVRTAAGRGPQRASPTETPSVFGHLLASPSTGLWLRVHDWPARGSGSEKGVIFLVHGFGEHMGRYEHVAIALSEAGYRVTGIDHQGHGGSEGDRTYVYAFEDYAVDLLALVARVAAGYTAEQRAERSWFAIGNSMGGLITTHAVLRGQREPWRLGGIRWSGIVLSGALFRPDPAAATPLKVFLAGCLAGLCPKLGLDPIRPQLLSRDAAVVERAMNDPLMYAGKILIGSGNAMLVAMDEAMAAAAEFAPPVRLQFGTADGIVQPQGSTDFHAACGSADKTLVRYEGLFHEVFNEPEKDRVIADVLGWIDERATPSAAGATAGAAVPAAQATGEA